MKKILLSITMLLPFVCVLAQNPSKEKDSKKKKIDKIFELMGFVNISSLPGESDAYSGTLLGGQIGGQVKLGQFSERLAVWGGAAFSMQGGKYKSSYTGGGDYGDGSLRLNYLNFPITARYQTKSGFFAEGGIQPGLLLSAKNNFNYSGSSGSNDVKDQINSFDIGIPIGLGYKFTENIGVSARFTPGITNINKSESTYEAPKNRNMVIALGATYAF